MSRIYRHHDQPYVDIPNLDLLSFLFDSEHSVAQDDTELHLDAEYPSQIMTKSALRSLTQRIAYGLRYKYGIGANGTGKDVVTVISYGQPMVAAVFFGIIAAGGVYSAASPSSTDSELVRQIKVGKSGLIICGGEFKDIVARASKLCNVPLERVLVLESKPSWILNSMEDNSSVISEEKLNWQIITDRTALTQSLIVILWSSGTTALPKGVMLSHRNLISETYLTALSGRDWAVKFVASGGELKPYRTLAHLPVSHIAGLFGYFIAPFYSGGLVVWMRRYEWKNLLKFAKEYQITAFYTVPSIYLRISKSPDVIDHFRSVDGASTGAAPMDGDLQIAANAKLGDGQTFIGQTWGLSETTGAVTMMPRGQSDTTGSLSPLLPNVELRIVDDDFNDVDPGSPGELILRAPMVTQGYFDNPKATEEAFYDGWFLTGDIGVEKDGKFYIVDRKKELFKYKGQQIPPAEIENLLFTHPRIQEAAVIGVPSPDDPSSELPRAYVVADPSEVSADEIKNFVKDRLSPYKQLRGGVVFVTELPKSAIGKFLRRELRESAKKEIKLASKL